MTIGRICSRDVHLARTSDTVLDAAARMKSHNVGALVVVDEARRPVGILTDRDLVVRVLTEGRAAGNTRVESVMTHEPRTLALDARVDDALAAMRGLGVRRMPVVGVDGTLAGVVSVDDVLGLIADELANVSKVLGKSACGVMPPATVPAEPRRGAAFATS